MKSKVLTVIPVYNEEKILPYSVDKVVNFLKEKNEFEFEIVIADNASNDNTPKISKKLCKKYNIKYYRLEKKRKG